MNLGKDGRKLIEKKYSWEEIVKEYIKYSFINLLKLIYDLIQIILFHIICWL